MSRAIAKQIVQKNRILAEEIVERLLRELADENEMVDMSLVGMVGAQLCGIALGEQRDSDLRKLLRAAIEETLEELIEVWDEEPEDAQP